ncbi:S8 family serine peptidase [Archangium sp.]|uniref:S8 family serine peptidase n=1 Tax=Archangium sp. TaxID=1872627 RepID=UPI002D71C34A|nr:S8 family serine peptidase [Archangium sp.]HYO52108.1 S8 family serine peptidase [Archangium sp.]
MKTRSLVLSLALASSLIYSTWAAAQTDTTPAITQVKTDADGQSPRLGLSPGEHVAQVQGAAVLGISPQQQLIQVRRSPFSAASIGEGKQIASSTRVVEARNMFKVDGTGTAVAILDSGLNLAHHDFAGRIRAPVNFVPEEGLNQDVTDSVGHGSNVAGVVVGNGRHIGIATGAYVVPVKILDRNKDTTPQRLTDALDWVLANAEKARIRVVSLSISDRRNYTTSSSAIKAGGSSYQAIIDRILALRNMGILVVTPAGNEYALVGRAGMGFPGIVPGAIAVGAVFDSSVNPLPVDFITSKAYRAKVDQIAPFSQRLALNLVSHGTESHGTDLFAPGVQVASAGSDLGDPYCESIASGTSQSVPVVAGAILLLQQFFFDRLQRWPTAEELEFLLKSAAREIPEPTNNDDDVPHLEPTAKYKSLDIYNLLATADAALKERSSVVP